MCPWASRPGRDRADDAADQVDTDDVERVVDPSLYFRLIVEAKIRAGDETQAHRRRPRADTRVIDETGHWRGGAAEDGEVLVLDALQGHPAEDRGRRGDLGVHAPGGDAVGAEAMSRRPA